MKVCLIEVLSLGMTIYCLDVDSVAEAPVGEVEAVASVSVSAVEKDAEARAKVKVKVDVGSRSGRNVDNVALRCS